MCNCGKHKASADEISGPVSRAKAIESEEMEPLMLDMVRLNLRPAVRVPIQLPVPTKDGNKTTIVFRIREEEVQRQMKVRLMQAYPHLFELSDPEWHYVGKDERAEQFFQAVNV